MAWETVLYAHPQGARLTRVMLTRKEPGGTDLEADVYWREHEEDTETNIATVTIVAGHRIGVCPLEGQVMRPMDSLVQVRCADERPIGLACVIGFGR